MVRHTAHLKGCGVVLVACGEGNIENFGRFHRVGPEELVKIPHAKKQKGVLVATLDFVVLLHERSGLGHEKHFLPRTTQPGKGEWGV